MKRNFFVAVYAILFAVTTSAQTTMTWEEAERKADEIISKLTIDEKVEMTRGYNKFFLPGVPEKGVPYVFTADASAGLRINTSLPDPDMVKMPEKTTQFPGTIALAATFNTELAYRYAESIGEECRMSGVGVLLGPGMNIYRNSQCGRNFEYLGEDPYLAARMVENYVRGMQSTGTMACLKHFLCNNTEFYRRRSNSIVDERAIMEIYTPAFKAGIDAGAGSVMTSYNQVNGEWAGESKYVIDELLRGQLGFRGMVMSDWRSIYDWQKVVRSGQNVDMPGENYFYIDKDATAAALVKRGVLKESEIDRMIRPQIAACVKFGLYERFAGGKEYDSSMEFKMPAHKDIAYETAAQGIVLLKNEGVLPISSGKKIYLVSHDMNPSMPPAGGGSAHVKGYDHVSLIDCLHPEVIKDYKGGKIEDADAVICLTGTYDAEASERTFAMSKEEEAFVRATVNDNPGKTIVVVCSGSGIDMSKWADKAAAIIYAWYPGQRGYEALADIIKGEINPSGKLPMTIERKFSDSPANGTVPVGASIANGKGNPNEYFFRVYDIKYEESVLVGYRWYENKDIKPLYPFGYGLSYTTFDIKNAKIKNLGNKNTISKNKPIKVSVTVENSGDRGGSEVVQLYVSEKNPTVVRPKKELKAFKRVTLLSHQKKVVEFELDPASFSYWDDKSHSWQMNSGQYVISIGNSSANIVTELPVNIL